MAKAIAWLRRDLRLHDSAVLAEACRLAEQVVVAFVYDRVILDALENKCDSRLVFIRESVEELRGRLEDLGSGLVCLHGDPSHLIPELAGRIGADWVVTGRDYEPYAIERDARVAASLSSQGRSLTWVNSHLAAEPGRVMTKDGAPFRVFTPFYREWTNVLAGPPSTSSMDTSRLSPNSVLANESTSSPTLAALGFEDAVPWTPPGEAAGMMRLQEFEAKIDSYGQMRDFPAENSTSGLSVHLRFGTVSIGECLRRAMSHDNPGASKWIAELAWRDFYHHILAHYPEVTTTTFNPKYRDLQWPGSREDFEKWCLGKTGYPIVDAAMRCLNATGWMHNRLRMVTAMFLTKDLLCDYKWGEEYFAAKLLDFDLASNNGGWQWSASTGADAQPYFRIFNPILQSRKFDPEAKFILRWVPELQGCDDPHWPHDGLFRPEGYVPPMVDHHAQKAKVLSLLGG